MNNSTILVGFRKQVTSRFGTRASSLAILVNEHLLSVELLSIMKCLYQLIVLLVALLSATSASSTKLTIRGSECTESFKKSAATFFHCDAPVCFESLSRVYLENCADPHNQCGGPAMSLMSFLLLPPPHLSLSLSAAEPGRPLSFCFKEDGPTRPIILACRMPPALPRDALCHKLTHNPESCQYTALPYHASCEDGWMNGWMDGWMDGWMLWRGAFFSYISKPVTCI